MAASREFAGNSRMQYDHLVNCNSIVGDASGAYCLIGRRILGMYKRYARAIFRFSQVLSPIYIAD